MSWGLLKEAAEKSDREPRAELRGLTVTSWLCLSLTLYALNKSLTSLNPWPVFKCAEQYWYLRHRASHTAKLKGHTFL